MIISGEFFAMPGDDDPSGSETTHYFSVVRNKLPQDSGLCSLG